MEMVTTHNYATTEMDNKYHAALKNNSTTNHANKSVFKDYCRASSLHGLKYIVVPLSGMNTNGSASGSGSVSPGLEESATLRYTRCTLWTLSTVLGTGLCIAMMMLVWYKFQTEPTDITIESTTHPIWDVPFPAVTICNINQVYIPQTNNLAEKLLNAGFPEENVTRFFQSLSSLTTTEIMAEENFVVFEKILSWGYKVDALMKELMQPCDKLLLSCHWLGQEVDCMNKFHAVTSALGYCCAFNYKETIVETTDILPDNNLYVSSAGRYGGLSVLVDVQTDLTTASTMALRGASVMLHSSMDYAEEATKKFILQPNYDVALEIMANVVESDSAVKSLAIPQRMCWFTDEKDLYSSDTYSHASCISQCRVSAILDVCGCMPYFYPDIHLRHYKRSEGESEYPQCTLKDLKCLRDNRNIFNSMQPPDHVGKRNINYLQKRGLVCDCLPSCSDCNYDVREIKSQRKASGGSKIFVGRNLTNVATLHVYFADFTCVKYRRDAVMSWDGLFAAFGGIFGLCMGGSLLSVIELVYFFTCYLYYIIYYNEKKVLAKGDPAPLKKGLSKNFMWQELRPYQVNIYRRPALADVID